MLKLKSMLVEVKVKVEQVTDGKTRKKAVTYLLDKNYFSEAEYDVTALLMSQNESGLVNDYEIQSLRLSSIKEIATQYSGEHSYIATLKDIWTEDDGTEKYLRYKVLLWADNLQDALSNTHEMAREGYDMIIESLKEVDYEYLENQNNE